MKLSLVSLFILISLNLKVKPSNAIVCYTGTGLNDTTSRDCGDGFCSSLEVTIDQVTQIKRQCVQTCAPLYKEFTNSEGKKQYCCNDENLCNRHGIVSMAALQCYDNRNCINSICDVVTCLPDNQCVKITTEIASSEDRVERGCRHKCSFANAITPPGASHIRYDCCDDSDRCNSAQDPKHTSLVSTTTFILFSIIRFL